MTAGCHGVLSVPQHGSMGCRSVVSARGFFREHTQKPGETSGVFHRGRQPLSSADSRLQVAALSPPHALQRVATPSSSGSPPASAGVRGGKMPSSSVTGEKRSSSTPGPVLKKVTRHVEEPHGRICSRDPQARPFAPSGKTSVGLEAQGELPLPPQPFDTLPWSTGRVCMSGRCHKKGQGDMADWRPTRQRGGRPLDVERLTGFGSAFAEYGNDREG